MHSYCTTVYAIVNDRLSALDLELAITPDMGHDRWANDVTLSNIHERSFFTSHFYFCKNTKVSKYLNTIRMLLKPTSIGYLSFKINR